MLVHVELLVRIGSVRILIEFVVDAAGAVIHMTVLQVAEDIPMTAEMPCSLQESAVVALGCVGIVVGVSSARKEFPFESIISDICQIPEVVTLEPLQGYSGYDIQSIHAVIQVPDQSVCILGQPFPADEIGPLHLLAVRRGETLYPEFRQFVVRAELVVIAVSISIMEGAVRRKAVPQAAGDRKDIVVLPEIVGCTGP